MIDAQGFRANVGIILADHRNRLFWARRKGQSGWQFPQGGIQEHETPEQAMYRELAEEIGLGSEHVEILGNTRRWLRYHLPSRYRRHDLVPVCIGQKQKWYLLRFKGDDSAVRLDNSNMPEFESWDWVGFWQPVREVIYFKRRVYRRALTELGPLIFPGGLPEAGT
ncbi:MAG: RNA pyrophosphohydrolase [Gammaproteobacteria bacterium]|nr:RNA pyrophosphohydrolase [Gammaproteobacteria bacterium]MDE2344949.1 RNA pyrophosphohydrolase [Gammaproteobacteria bacterium]